MKLKNILLLITPSSPGRFTGIARFAREHHWHLTIANRLSHTLTGWNGDGALVTLRDDEAVVEYVKALRHHRIPVVDLSNSRPEIILPRVAGDNAAIGRAAAAHFAERNYHHVAWFSSTWGSQHEIRFAAFAEAFPDAQQWVWGLENSHTDNWTALSKWLRSRLMSSSRPIGVFCYDDADASHVEAVALSAGLSVPRDVAILGAGDDVPLCEAQTIPISSVRHNLDRNGYEGAALLEALMNGEKTDPAPRLLAPDGVAERDSTSGYGASDELVKRALDIYQSDLTHPPRTDELARLLGVSRATLDRAFAADTGHAPAKVLVLLRLEKARQLMRQGKTLKETAYAVGFCSPAHFSNTYSKHFHVAPSRDPDRPLNHRGRR